MTKHILLVTFNTPALLLALLDDTLRVFTALPVVAEKIVSQQFLKLGEVGFGIFNFLVQS